MNSESALAELIISVFFFSTVVQDLNQGPTHTAYFYELSTFIISDYVRTCI